MDDDRGLPLLGIGDFSRYAGLSVRMLRHYGERGLLEPARVDAFTGYRFYSHEQLRTAGRIRALRDAGCGIPLIAELLPLFDDDPSALRARLGRHIRSLDAAARDLAAQRSLADSLLARLDAPEAARASVGTRMFPALRVLYLRRTVMSYPAEGELWGELRELMAEEAGVQATAFGPMIGASYFDAEYRDNDVEMAIWREYRGAWHPLTEHRVGHARGFDVLELPRQEVAWATHFGGFETLSETTELVGGWITSTGRVRRGPLFNVYVVGPGSEPDPVNWVTEVNVPV